MNVRAEICKMAELKITHNGCKFYEVPTHTGHSYTPSVHWFYSYWEKPYPSPTALLKARNDLG
jgi:hypothetical protein